MLKCENCGGFQWKIQPTDLTKLPKFQPGATVKITAAMIFCAGCMQPQDLTFQFTLDVDLDQIKLGPGN